MLDFLLQPEIDVGLSVNEPLLDVSQLNAGNLLTVTMETLYAPPESWTHTGTQYAFAAALPVPFNGEVFEPVRKKTNNLGSDQVRHKPGCTVAEDG